jgi:hypothetical protein
MKEKMMDERTMIMLATQAVKRNAQRLVYSMSAETTARLAEHEEKVQLAKQALMNATRDANDASMNVINHVELP